MYKNEIGRDMYKFTYKQNYEDKETTVGLSKPCSPLIITFVLLLLLIIWGDEGLSELVEGGLGLECWRMES